MNRRTLLSCLPIVGVLPSITTKHLCAFWIENDQVFKKDIDDTNDFINGKNNIAFIVDRKNKLLHFSSPSPINKEFIAFSTQVYKLDSNFFIQSINYLNDSIGILFFKEQNSNLVLCSCRNIKLIQELCDKINQEIKSLH